MQLWPQEQSRKYIRMRRREVERRKRTKVDDDDDVKLAAVIHEDPRAA